MAEAADVVRFVRICMKDGNQFDMPAPGADFSLGAFMGFWKSTDFVANDQAGCGMRWSEMAWCKVIFGTREYTPSAAPRKDN